jgi:hemerythrin-like domain-containing protein
MEYLTAEHHRLTALFDRARSLVDKGVLAQAAAVFQAFAQTKRRHMRLEERWLFPSFEERTGSSTGLTALLRDEHRRLERILEEASAALERGRADDFRALCLRLTLIVEDHTFHEEAQLYPVIEEILSPHERDVCLRRMHDKPLLPHEVPEAAGPLAGG